MPALSRDGKGVRVSHETQREQTIEDAIAAGFRIEYGNNSTLQIDIDDKLKLPDLLKLWKRFKSNLKITRVILTNSKSGNLHAFIHLKYPIATPRERMLLQAALGSDPVREILNWREVDDDLECFLIEVGTEGREIEL